jgi:hypothetical protein
MLARIVHRLMNEETRFRKDEGGQILVFTALAGLVLVMMTATVFNIGMVVGEKMKVQNAADAAAYTQAVQEARVLNLIAYFNRAVISHMVTVAFCTALYSVEDFWSTVRFDLSFLSFLPVGDVIYNVIQGIWLASYALTLVADRVRPDAETWGMQMWWNSPVSMYPARLLTVVTESSARDRISRFVHENIDPDIDVNTGGWGSQFSDRNAANLRKIADFRTIPFESISRVYQESCDGFSRGESFWRKFGMDFLGTGFGIKGTLTVSDQGIEQAESLFAELAYRNLYTSPPVGQASYPRPDFTGQGFWTYTFPSTDYYNDPERFPSVYMLASKSGENVKKSQIPLLGIESSLDICAVARARVFYWDPNRDRSASLAVPSQFVSLSANLPLEPNLFNPFWHARLAPMDDYLNSASWDIHRNRVSYLDGP